MRGEKWEEVAGYRTQGTGANVAVGTQRRSVRPQARRSIQPIVSSYSPESES
ncbi:hypothetical protein [Agriterribacter sp.]|uniref:hypothetical protein n=1 Tax=Agriterribacter sp. TaxID=2821509 RepID=UPI002CE869E0|nr:hypothetical protein [Agriterribacter sp.]HTN05510.1 hypothetical protein [Agriterribacter sp.]